MAVSLSGIIYNTAGAESERIALMTLDNSYPNPAGYTLTASALGLSRFSRIEINDASGYTFSIGDLSAQPSTVAVHVYSGASGTTGPTSGGTPAGTNGTSSVTAQTFTGTSPVSDLNLATPAFSGTGLTAAGQVITTTSTHTMTLNQCAGMWLIPATGATPVMLILSNTAVAGAAAVLTVQGSASTDAGAYKIVKSLTPIGTNSASTAAAQTFTGTALSTHTHSVGAAAGGEVANGVDLSAVSTQIVIYGF